MSTYLLATASVHVTAAAADYLADRLDPADDEVVVIGVREPGGTERDPADAANVARSRLAAVGPEVDLREGEPTTEIRATIAERDPDVVVIGANAGTAESSGLGSTASDLLAAADRPVVVVPVPELS